MTIYSPSPKNTPQKYFINIIMKRNLLLKTEYNTGTIYSNPIQQFDRPFSSPLVCSKKFYKIELLLTTYASHPKDDLGQV